MIDRVETLINQGNELENQGRFADALDCYLMATRVDPKHALAWINAGIAQAELGQREQASLSFRMAIEISDHPASHLNLATLLIDDADYAQSEHHYLRALTLRPNWAEARFGLICVAQAKKDPTLVALLRQFIADNPDHVQSQLMLAETLSSTDIDQGLQILNALPNDLAAVHSKRASCLAMLFDHTAARKESREALRLEPTNAGYLMSYAFGSMSDPDADPFLLPGEISTCLERIPPSTSTVFRPETTTRNKPARYRIGYLSGDYRAHPVANFLYPVFKHHDRSHFQIIALANVHEQDPITTEFRKLSDDWIDLHELSDQNAVEVLRKLHLDAVIDFSGWTERNRICLLHQRVAPVQATAFAVYLTTGVPNVDFRICDESSDPSDTTEAMHSERLIKIEGPQVCYHEFRPIPSQLEQPLDANGHFTFGFFNQSNKIGIPMMEAWSQILSRNPQSQLSIIGVDNPSSRKQIFSHLTQRGVFPTQINISGRVAASEYARALTNVDLALDSFPWNGGTTTIETLLAGVPVLTLSGQRPSSRSSRVFLDPLGLSDWAHESIESWTQAATNAARDSAVHTRLRQLRKRLPALVRESALMMPTNYIVRWENAIRKMLECNERR